MEDEEGFWKFISLIESCEPLVQYLISCQQVDFEDLLDVID